MMVGHAAIMNICRLEIDALWIYFDQSLRNFDTFKKKFFTFLKGIF